MRTQVFSGSIVSIALVLAACGGGGAATEAPAVTSGPATEAPATAASATDAPATEAPDYEPTAGASEPAAGASEAAVALADTSLGKVLVDGKGLTLYMFTADSKDTSTCYDSCAANWPPLLGTAVPGTGLDASLFGATKRTDGTSQVTFNGMPLYLFAGDAAAGDVNGQGVGGKWYVLGADGVPIK